MAKPESRYTFIMTVEVQEEGKDERAMNRSSVTWAGLNYATLVAIEKQVVGLLDATTEWGAGKAEQLGQGDELRALLGAGR